MYILLRDFPYIYSKGPPTLIFFKMYVLCSSIDKRNHQCVNEVPYVGMEKERGALYSIKPKDGTLDGFFFQERRTNSM